MSESNEFFNANLKYLLDYTGDRGGDIEADILRILFQVKNLTHYDRAKGGSFENLENEPSSELLILLYTTNIIESIYLLNQEREFKNYIVVGYEDIKVNAKAEKFFISVSWRLLQDLQRSGAVEIAL